MAERYGWQVSRQSAWRVLSGRGLSKLQEREPLRRFERPYPNQLWQMDLKEEVVSPFGKAHLLAITDDASREGLAIDVSRHITSEDVLERLAQLFVERGTPGYLESFNGKLRDELLAWEVSDALLEAKVLVVRWRKHHHAVRPHSALENLSPEDFARASTATASAVGGKR